MFEEVASRLVEVTNSRRKLWPEPMAEGLSAQSVWTIGLVCAWAGSGARAVSAPASRTRAAAAARRRRGRPAPTGGEGRVLPAAFRPLRGGSSAAGAWTASRRNRSWYGALALLLETRARNAEVKRTIDTPANRPGRRSPGAASPESPPQARGPIRLHARDIRHARRAPPSAWTWTPVAARRVAADIPVFPSFCVTSGNGRAP